MKSTSSICAGIALILCAILTSVVKAQDSDNEFHSITIQLFDDAGKPLPNTPLRKHYLYRADDNETPQIDNSPLQTDSGGKVRVAVTGSPLQLMIHADVDGFVPMYAMWRDEQFARGEVSENVTFQLQRGTTIGGRVVDEDGKPVPKVVVEVRCEIADPPSGDARVSGSLADEEEGTEAYTDANGEWSIHNAPAGTAKFYVALKHPEFASDPGVIAVRGQPTDSGALRDRTARFEMQRGVIVSGRVTDRNGDPVTAGYVILGDYPTLARKPAVFEIQRDGTYRLPPQKPGNQRLTVVADGFAPQTRQVELTSMMEDPDFQLQPGHPVTIQIVDENGERIAGALVSIEGWQNTRTIYNMPSRNPHVRDLGISFRADEAGVFHWDSAPADPVDYVAGMPGYDPAPPVKLAPSDEPHVIKLRRSTTMAGRVIDATTQQPVDNFLVVPLRYRTHRGAEYPVEDLTNVVVGRQGEFRIDSGRRIRSADTKFGIKIEAVNYAPVFIDSASVANSDPVELTPQPWPSVQIVDPDGNPVTGCSVRVFSRTARMTLHNYEADDRPGRSPIKTDGEGRALVPPSETPFSVIVIDRAGYAEVGLSPDDTEKKIPLQKWALLEGQVSDAGGQTSDNRIIFEGIRVGHGPVTIVQDLTSTDIDEQGRFRFERLPPILGHLRTLGRNEQREEFNRYGMPVKLEPGETAVANLGFGITVTGSFELQGAEADHDQTHNVFRPIVPPKYGWPEGVAELNELDWRGGWTAYQQLIKDDYIVTPRVYMHSIPSCTAKVDAEGNFAINLPEAGQYDLAHLPVCQGSGKRRHDFRNDGLSGQAIRSHRVRFVQWQTGSWQNSGTCDPATESRRTGERD